MSAPLRLLTVHVLGEGGPALERERVVRERFVAVAAECPDCPARPGTVIPTEGFSAAVQYVHAHTCPMMVAALRRAGRQL